MKNEIPTERIHRSSVWQRVGRLILKPSFWTKDEEAAHTPHQ